MLESQELSPIQSFLLKKFVDRKRELSHFCEMLETNEQIVLLVTGESDIGKSAFMVRLIDECRKRDWYRALVPCDLMTNVDIRSVMRKLRSEIGRDHFASFDDADMKLGGPAFKLNLGANGGGTVSVAEQASIEDTSIENLAGTIVNVSNLQVNISEEHLDVLEKERRSNLTYQFIDCLAKISKENKLVIFFDAIEKMPNDVAKWVMDELIVAAVSGDIRNIKFVQCGQRKPHISKFIKFAVSETPLKPLEEKDIVEYLEKRGFEFDEPEDIAKDLLAKTGGFAGRVAQLIDAFEEDSEH